LQLGFAEKGPSYLIKSCASRRAREGRRRSGQVFNRNAHMVEVFLRAALQGQWCSGRAKRHGRKIRRLRLKSAGRVANYALPFSYRTCGPAPKGQNDSWRFQRIRGGVGPAKLLQHFQPLLAFGPTAGLTHAQIDHDAVAILHQHAFGVTEPGLFAGALFRLCLLKTWSKRINW
jgi:hypothetical protein